MSHRRLYILINIDFYFALENNVVDGLRWGGGGGAGLNVGRFFLYCIIQVHVGSCSDWKFCLIELDVTKHFLIWLYLSY